MFFLTICGETRGKNLLCQPDVATALFAAARHYHEKQNWFLRLMLLLPDHLHALLALAPDLKLGGLVGNWKRYIRRKVDIAWQKDFFDHRLRSDESWEEKAAYIRANPVRAGLIDENKTWPFLIMH